MLHPDQSDLVRSARAIRVVVADSVHKLTRELVQLFALCAIDKWRLGAPLPAFIFGWLEGSVNHNQGWERAVTRYLATLHELTEQPHRPLFSVRCVSSS